jgi:hypothetical protein
LPAGNRSIFAAAAKRVKRQQTPTDAGIWREATEQGTLAVGHLFPVETKS